MKQEAIEMKAKQMACTGCTYPQGVCNMCARYKKLVSMATWARNELAEQAANQAVRMVMLHNPGRLYERERRSIKEEVKRVMMEE